MAAWTSRPGATLRLFAGVSVVAVAGLVVGSGAWLDLPWWAGCLAGINLVTVGMYGYDKLAARRGGLRVPEVMLHALALIGGTPGALVARPLFRHKTRKGSFRAAFWAIVFVQAVSGAVIVWRVAG